MPDSLPKPPRPRPSTRYVWLRILAWTLPGITAPAFVFVWLAVSYLHSSYQNLVTIGALGSLGVLTIGAGIFDTVLHLTRTRGRENLRPGMIIGWSCAFVGAQLFLMPILGITIMSACNAILSL